MNQKLYPMWPSQLEKFLIIQPKDSISRIKANAAVCRILMMTVVFPMYAGFAFGIILIPSQY